MDWSAYVDSYCERLAPGLWGEPLNTVSNLSFAVAAIAIWRQAGDSREPRTGRTLAVLIGLVFVASTAFHALATRWAGAADTGFILVFVLYYSACFTHLFGRVVWRRAWFAAPAFLACTVAAVFALRGLDFDGVSYLPPLLAILGFAAWLATRRDESLRRLWPRFAVAGGVFGVSLTLRTADHGVCGNFPPGTHFLWHLCNGVVLYLVSRAAVLRAGRAGSPARPASPPPSAPGSR